MYRKTSPLRTLFFDQTNFCDESRRRWHLINLKDDLKGKTIHRTKGTILNGIEFFQSCGWWRRMKTFKLNSNWIQWNPDLGGSYLARSGLICSRREVAIKRKEEKVAIRWWHTIQTNWMEYVTLGPRESRPECCLWSADDSATQFPGKARSHGCLTACTTNFATHSNVPGIAPCPSAALTRRI